MLMYYPAKFIRKSREDSGHKKAFIARRLDMGESDYGKIENGKRSITPKLWHKISEELSLPAIAPNDEVLEILGRYQPWHIEEAFRILKSDPEYADLVKPE